MITTTLDILYLVLSGCAIVLTVVLSILLMRVARVVKQFTVVGLLTEKVLESFEKYIRIPARLLLTFGETATSFLRKKK